MGFFSSVVNLAKRLVFRSKKTNNATTPTSTQKLKHQTISLDAFKKDQPTIDRLKWITSQPECFPNVTNFDLHTYQHGHFVLLRDLSLTTDPNDPKNIVGYNFLSEGRFKHPETKKICAVVKLGPTAILPSYVGSHFAASTTSRFLTRVLVKNKLFGRRVFTLGALVNPFMRAVFDIAGAISNKSSLPAQLTTLMQAMVPACYPNHVKPEEFVHEGVFFSRWNTTGGIPWATPQVAELSLAVLRAGFSIARKATKVIPRHLSKGDILRGYLHCIFSMQYPVLDCLSDSARIYLTTNPKTDLTDISSERMVLSTIIDNVLSRGESLELSTDQTYLLRNFSSYLKENPTANPELDPRHVPQSAAAASSAPPAPASPVRFAPLLSPRQRQAERQTTDGATSQPPVQETPPQRDRSLPLAFGAS